MQIGVMRRQLLLLLLLLLQLDLLLQLQTPSYSTLWRRSLV